MKWQKKISTKVILILIETFLLISIALGIFSFIIEKNLNYRELVDTAAQTHYRIRRRIEDQLIQKNFWVAEKLIDLELESNTQLIAVIVQDADETMLVGRIKKDGLTISNYNPDTRPPDDFSSYLLEKKIGPSSSPLVLMLYFSNKPMFYKLRNFILRNMAITIILLIAIGIILYFSLSRQIIKPIVVLNNVVEMVNLWEFDTMAPVMADDEIGQLADSFNDMTVKLRSNFNKIQDYNEHLEEMVKKRTEELARAIEKLTKANKKMKNDLQMAKKVQMSIIPKNFPTLGMLNIYGSYLPMDDIGGDFYDVFQISDSKVAFVMADVCGHGISSALITSMAKVSFANNTKDNLSPGDILGAVNEELCTNLGETGFYLTAFYCIIDKTTRKMEYSSAGHPDIFILREQNETLVLESNSIFLGFVKGARYTSTYQYLKKDDRIVLYTDGLTEAKNDSKEFYEKQFFIKMLEKKALPPREYVDYFLEDLKLFSGKKKLKDDVTILIIDFIMDDYEVHIDIQNEYEYIERRGVRSQSKLNFINLNNKFVEALKEIDDTNYPGAIKILKGLVDKFYKWQDNFNVLKLLGYSYYKTSDLNNAIKYWEKAISINPHAEELVVNLGRLWERIKK